ncbi:sigma 54-interacting transcriptional regulator [Paenibacillus flagellatus]|uniref:Sigma-54-dependent Fis family transcriptional regulator n=1 Tax=Paenibacillus flagellatus TaxID=2211139 RepID=A0A2V5JZP4_9BACL|nr:sigma 54-interacting transcriptional regulator [Paenibacillus flagellatus]PYI51772.1 sigma-54-dependent Fis family transcriptional regulator [Paenibacillus flagellatus]
MDDISVVPKRADPFFAALLESVGDAVTMVDPNGVVLHWNEAAERFYGIARGDIVGRRIGDFFRKESVMLYQVMESGAPVRDVYHEPKPGVHVILNAVPVTDETGALLGAVSIERDITNYVRMSEELYRKPDAESNGLDTVLPSSGDRDEQVRLMAAHDVPLLLSGEAGAGKRSIAMWIHRRSGANGPFVAVACGAVPGGLLETELFGYAGGPYGDAGSERPGKLEAAAGGSVYIKDIHLMPAPAQEKLAAALSERAFARSGGSETLPLTCRIFATVPDDAERFVEEGTLLAKLFYAFQLYRVPPLRERKADLPQLCHLLLSEAAKQMEKPVPTLHPEAMAALAMYDWPGNLPQLKNAMEHVMIVARGAEATAADLPASIRMTTLSGLTQPAIPLTLESEEMERTRIEEALRRTNGNKAGAARLLGISRGALYYKLRQYGLD